MNWKEKRVLVTGGASFIGSHLSEALIQRGARVRVVDNLSSGKKENVNGLIIKYPADQVDFLVGDLNQDEVIHQSLSDIEVVFHLAADHGGRGYVDLHQVACSTNLGMDSRFFRACEKAKVERIIYASSGCVYPNYIQTDPGKKIYLTEEMVGPPYESDNLYGWAKLMAEMTLKAYHTELLMKTASCRYFTVYGERGKEDHAVIAMIAKAFIRQDPFQVWGDGTQIRNWTHVSDIVEGTILTAERIEDGTAINLGTTERIRVGEAAKEVIRYVRKYKYPDYEPSLKLMPEMPTGPYNRVASNALAKKVLGWEPKVKFMEGLHRTIDWYFRTKKVDEVGKIVANSLTER